MVERTGVCFKGQREWIYLNLNKEDTLLETRINSKALQKFAETAAIISNPETEEWKNSGGKIIGYFCSSMPVELITAAGFFPFRLRATGSTNTDLSDTYFSSLLRSDSLAQSNHFMKK